jgi:hypothetical protein
MSSTINPLWDKDRLGDGTTDPAKNRVSRPDAQIYIELTHQRIDNYTQFRSEALQRNTTLLLPYIQAFIERSELSGADVQEIIALFPEGFLPLFSLLVAGSEAVANSLSSYVKNAGDVTGFLAKPPDDAVPGALFLVDQGMAGISPRLPLPAEVVLVKLFCRGEREGTVTPQQEIVPFQTLKDALIDIALARVLDLPELVKRSSEIVDTYDGLKGNFGHITSEQRTAPISFKDTIDRLIDSARALGASDVAEGYGQEGIRDKNKKQL